MSEKTKSHKSDLTWKERASEYMVNDGPKVVFIFLWAAGTIALFVYRFVHYYKSQYFLVLGHGVTISRGSAASISFNSALMLLTMARNFLSLLRTSFVGPYIPVDKNIIFHRYMGWCIVFFAGLHIGGHFFNYHTLSSTSLDLLALMNKQGIKPAANPLAFNLMYTTLPGATGVLVTLCMVLMYSSAIKYVRGPMFNVFWYTHHLFIIYFGLLCVHGASATLEPASFWMYFVGPGFIYLIERSIRILRGSQNTILQLAVAHPSKVIELQMKKSTFKYKPGQYLFLNCPYIANQEWHPFTISSAPEEDFVSVHIRIVGDWTGDLWALLNKDKKLGVVQENLLTAPDASPILRIDGPFGAASEDVFKFKTVLLCAGGIGVTPFASILKSIRYKLQSGSGCVIEKAYFYWISRDKNAFEWFNDVLAALEYENVNNFLEIHTYLTGQLSVDEIRNVMYQDSDTDQITGLQSPTHFGRPDWDNIFAGLAQKHVGSSVGVFFCGPAILSKQLYKMCRKHTNIKTATKFVFHKENF